MCLVKMNTVKCFNCKFSTTDEEKLLSHVKIHLHEATFSIKCQRCPQVSGKSSKQSGLKALDAHRKHIKVCKLNFLKIKNETKKRQDEEKSGFVWQCQLCDENIELKKLPNIDDFEAIKLHCYKHANEGIVPPCPICEKQYQVNKKCQLLNF